MLIGQFLFPGKTNNQMLKLFMELRGPFPEDMLSLCAYRDKHFDKQGNFLQQERPPGAYQARF